MPPKAHPLSSRIKKIMQKDEDVGKISQATPILIGRAMECLLKKICEKTAEIASGRQAKTITTSHVKACILSEETMDFLKEVVASAPDLALEEAKPAKETKPRKKKAIKEEDGSDPDAMSPSEKPKRGRPSAKKKQEDEGGEEDGSSAPAPARRKRKPKQQDAGEEIATERDCLANNEFGQLENDIMGVSYAQGVEGDYAIMPAEFSDEACLAALQASAQAAMVSEAGETASGAVDFTELASATGGIEPMAMSSEVYPPITLDHLQLPVSDSNQSVTTPRITPQNLQPKVSLRSKHMMAFRPGKTKAKPVVTEEAAAPPSAVPHGVEIEVKDEDASGTGQCKQEEFQQQQQLNDSHVEGNNEVVGGHHDGMASLPSQQLMPPPLLSFCPSSTHGLEYDDDYDC